MTQQPTARRGARPLTFLACALLALCTASCTTFFPVLPERQSWADEALQKAGRMKSIEAFGRDIEPTLIQVRNELINESNFNERQSWDYIYSQPVDNMQLYTLVSPTISFVEDDVRKVQAVVKSQLTPLGFNVQTREQTTEDNENETLISAANPTYGVTVNVYVRDSKRANFLYETQPLKSDGSTDNPMEVADIPGRRPDWMVLTPPE